ncbi:MAG: hypothetical protein U0794_13995 [Isosphaeraceae bacterium]
MTAATSLREPSTDQAPLAWDLLAEGALAASKPDRAGALEARGADRAAELGQARLAQELRLKAGAAFFQAGDFDQAVTYSPGSRTTSRPAISALARAAPRPLARSATRPAPRPFDTRL